MGPEAEVDDVDSGSAGNSLVERAGSGSVAERHDGVSQRELIVGCLFLQAANTQ